ncbi:phage protein [Spirochaetia bacterium]|nr:phage protein [Spirochaetia bacterium]
MRDILFRGNRKDTGEWAYGDLSHLSYGVITINDAIVHAETVGQYTGLRDKNGVKIFEGDVVKADKQFMEKFCPHEFYLIDYLRGSYRMYFYPLSPNKADNEKFNTPLFNSNGYIEVIGNIHDNPELLEAVK